MKGRRIRKQLTLFPKSDDANKRKSPDGVTTSKLICTAHVGTNEELFPLILDLHVPPGSVVVDVTYGKGIFWEVITHFIPPLITSTILSNKFLSLSLYLNSSSFR